MDVQTLIMQNIIIQLTIIHLYVPLYLSEDGQLFSSVSVLIKVLDVNDNVPTLSKDYQLYVCEDTEAGEVHTQNFGEKFGTDLKILSYPHKLSFQSSANHQTYKTSFRRTRKKIFLRKSVTKQHWPIHFYYMETKQMQVNVGKLKSFFKI